ncbi:DIE2/ALG10 family-domain-containing protein [Microdochium trichocladiopsis]|uniref:Dol-P-Glc:Glc(2)Man(9)GlcNAc(2)-PP-Dol alpha-1,2-glucosyltransferase n=1 Tax=Microdochium trichocladiopsis TaxID=1682393 RepID=A0A9P8Y890_9PEZI|nr:DIE2/ALG10 family-domain-containing protein [Microdochium trichocladiopsis]KAH7031678.1 DIE2/ALG10 family-domain-containing protein [Microdochium trichocladiopsis]
MDLAPPLGVTQLATAACLLAAAFVYHKGTPATRATEHTLATITAGVVPFVCGLTWLKLVTKAVPEPYLDEVFHIPQAQVYCEGRYFDWDDKITTPPGLYLLSIWLIQGTACSARNLRMVNVGIVACIAIVAALCLELQRRKRPSQPAVGALGAGTNVALFPVIFFFSGLYYTDGASTLVVLLAYWSHLVRAEQTRPSILSDLMTIILGLTSLVMRQTNIFWVVVYMGGLEAVNAVKGLQPEPVERPQSDNLITEVKFYLSRYAVGDVHDPSLTIATPIVDVALCAISLLAAGACNLLPILRRIWPHITVLSAFVGFVVWNGGVVLGDKSNHVATLHLAQMLYIWPLFVFFSAPLVLLPVLQLVQHAWASLTEQNRHSKPTTKPSQTMTASFATSQLAQGVIVLTAALGVAAGVVHFSTIIHPFTLADNRHYMFYVFRYSILRAWWVRFALVPVYVACAWLCWITLQGRWDGSTVAGPQDCQQRNRWVCSPWWTEDSVTASRGGHESIIITGQKADKKQVQGRHSLETNEPTAPSTSTVLILLVATTLSLMTAPLVEPRYFILPWVFWRLLVPAWPLSIPTPETRPSPRPPASSHVPDQRGQSAALSAKESSSSPARPWWARFDVQILLETVWFGIINAATMYIFLTRPFYWKNPDGSLADGGRVQRFMW